MKTITCRRLVPLALLCLLVPGCGSKQASKPEQEAIISKPGLDFSGDFCTEPMEELLKLVRANPNNGRFAVGWSGHGCWGGAVYNRRKQMLRWESNWLTRLEGGTVTKTSGFYVEVSQYRIQQAINAYKSGSATNSSSLFDTLPQFGCKSKG